MANARAIVGDDPHAGCSVNLESRLAAELVRSHPTDAAAVLDRLPAEEAVVTFERVPAADAAPVLARISPLAATEILARLDAATAARLISALPDDVAARLLRRVGDECRTAILNEMSGREARIMHTLLGFAENTAGALMDPDVLAVAEDLSVDEALARARQFPDQAHYNVYIIDREQVLVGAVNLRELLLAPGDARLSSIMVANPHRLQWNADSGRIASHPGWRYVHAIPVVDERGRYLGSVRYRTLRQLEEELLGAAQTDVNATEALGDLFAAGATGLLDALSGRPTKRGAGWT